MFKQTGGGGPHEMDQNNSEPVKKSGKRNKINLDNFN